MSLINLVWNGVGFVHYILKLCVIFLKSNYFLLPLLAYLNGSQFLVDEVMNYFRGLKWGVETIRPILV